MAAQPVGGTSPGAAGSSTGDGGADDAASGGSAAGASAGAGAAGTSGGGAGAAGMSSGGPGGACMTEVCGPCADLCSNPKNVNDQANPATTGAICYERTTPLQGANVGNVAGAGLQVNGQAVNATGNVSPWPAKRFGGYCFQSSSAFGWLSLF
ncbi:MAG TPA: hypothetical protein VHB79_39700 [Polyangiaceae bacterium]|nr:hypothetical protein [Polyangiaceae bacterium]